MQNLKNIRSLGIVLAISALLAACGNGTGAPAEEGDQPADSAPAEDTAPAGDEADGEPKVSVTFDGEPVEFEEVHCVLSPGNEGRARLFAIYDGGDLEINADEDPERGVNVWIEPDDGPDFFDREPHGIDFSTGAARGDVEVKDGDGNAILVSFDIDCRL